MEGALERKTSRNLPHITRKQAALLVGLLVLLVFGYAGLRRLVPNQAATANVQTSAVQRGTLQATVNTAGNIAAARELSLSFQTPGQVKTVDVKVGDQVRARSVRSRPPARSSRAWSTTR